MILKSLIELSSKSNECEKVANKASILAIRNGEEEIELLLGAARSSSTKHELYFLITITRTLPLFAIFSHSFDFEDNLMIKQSCKNKLLSLVIPFRLAVFVVLGPRQQ